MHELGLLFSSMSVTALSCRDQVPSCLSGSPEGCVLAGFLPINFWKIPWRRKQQPTPVLLPGRSHQLRRLPECSSWACKELDMTQQLNNNTISLLRKLNEFQQCLGYSDGCQAMIGIQLMVAVVVKVVLVTCLRYFCSTKGHPFSWGGTLVQSRRKCILIRIKTLCYQSIKEDDPDQEFQKGFICFSLLGVSSTR